MFAALLLASLTSLSMAQECSDIESWSPSQILYSGRSVNDLGDYDACTRDTNSIYYLSVVNVGIASINLGICAPIACSPEAVSNAVNSVLQLDEATQEISIQAAPLREYDMGVSGVLWIIFASMMALFVAIGTFLDFKHAKPVENSLLSKEESEPKSSVPEPRTQIHAFTQHFSLRLNLEELMQTRPASTMKCLDGIRVISMWWIVCGHVVGYRMQTPVGNVFAIFRDLNDVLMSFGYGGAYAVDTFFWLSGFLIGYLTLPTYAARGKFGVAGWIYIYAHRFARILPPYLFLIWFAATVFPTMLQGPAWEASMEALQGECEDYWWTNLLFVNNFIPWWQGSWCYGMGWYLANDMQFYYVAPLLIVIYFKAPKVVSWIMFLIILIASIITTASIAYEHNITVGFLSAQNLATPGIFEYIYTKPYCRIPPFLIAIFSAFLMAAYRKKVQSDPISKWVENVLTSFWGNIVFLAGVALWFFWVLGQVSGYQNDMGDFNNFTHMGNAVFLGLQHAGYGLSLSLVILPLLYGKVGWLCSILGHDIWEPLGKITFSLFLAHIFAVRVTFGSQRSPWYWSYHNLGKEIIFVVLFSYVLAFIVYFLIEAPFANLEKSMWGMIRGKKKSSH